MKHQYSDNTGFVSKAKTTLLGWILWSILSEVDLYLNNAMMINDYTMNNLNAYIVHLIYKIMV